MIKLEVGDLCKSNILLHQKFDVEATYLSSCLESELMKEKGKVQDSGNKALLSLLVELELMLNMETERFPYRDVLDTYEVILSYTQETENKVWVLQHHSCKASKVFEAIKSADRSILENDGFWVVNNRLTMFWKKAGMDFQNLNQLFSQSGKCKMKLEKHKFGASSQSLATCKDPENVKTCLEDFIIKSLALEKKIDELMKAWVGDDGVPDIFREALFYHMPKKLEILYDQDLDMNRHCDTMPLGFTLQGGDSLVDANSRHLQVKCLDANEDAVYELYDFNEHQLEDIEQGDCRTAHSFPLLDDAFGKCVRLWCEQNRNGRGLEIIQGVNRGAIIASTFGTRTSIHVEDAMLATFNLLVVGAPKIWYFVPRCKGLEFKEFLKRRKWLNNTLQKRCYPQTFCDKPGVYISKEDMHRFGVRRIVQRPGMTIMSIPGLLFHWTISTGFSLADSSNYFINVGEDLKQIQDMWNAYQSEANCSNCGAIETSRKYFEICSSFKLL